MEDIGTFCVLKWLPEAVTGKLNEEAESDRVSSTYETVADEMIGWVTDFDALPGVTAVAEEHTRALREGGNMRGPKTSIRSASDLGCPLASSGPSARRSTSNSAGSCAAGPQSVDSE